MAGNGDNADNESYDVVLYRQAVLRKYGITQAEFDSSLVYYMRHADRLHKIYENLSKRFEDDAMALGASANDIRQFGDMKSVRDTSNLWRGVPSAMFLPKAPYNVMTFDITADSTYQKGDKLIFSFNCDLYIKKEARMRLRCWLCNLRMTVWQAVQCVCLRIQTTVLRCLMVQC